MALLLGVDLGTTATKGVLCDPEGRIVAVASRPVALHADDAGFAEADTTQWWGNACGLVPELLGLAGARGNDVAAVATSGMVPAVVALGEHGPLRRAILQNDARAVREISDIGSKMEGVDFVALTGSALSQQSVAPTLLWLARHEPDVWESTRAVVGSSDWLAQALGAEPFLEQNWALESGLFCLDGSLLAPALDAAGAPPAWLAPVRRTGDTVGAVSPAAAAATTLAAGTPIVVGGADHVLSAVAAGLSAPGDALVKLGGAGDILVVADRPLRDGRLYLDAHPQPGLWLPNGCMATSGSLIRWLQQLLGAPDLSALDQEAESVPPAEVLCLPYFLGEKSPLHDPLLRGAFVGLHLATSRGALHRSVLEAVAFGFRHHFDVLDEVGVAVGRTLVTNGGSSSLLWKHILADVLDVPLEPVLGHPGAAYGAALAAGVGVGWFDGWSHAAGRLPAGEPIQPDPDRVAAYGGAYRTWRQLGDALTPFSHKLAEGHQLAEGSPC